MPHNIDLILTLTVGLTAAWGLGLVTQKLKLSPIVGYLLAGILVGPFSPGYVAETEIASQFAEIGVMFGVGLHFHLKDLLTVRKIAIPGAIVQILAATALGAGVTRMFGWFLVAALVGFALIAWQRAIPWFLGYVARTGSRDLFTLAVLVLALGIAVGSAQLFGASMALGAFLAGMIVGQSEFGARSASDALPMRDAFAVLFFVSVGMLFGPTKVPESCL
jgi:monovalent cation:H+ antiporter-2, CPA2 family